MHRYLTLRFFVLVSALILSACAGVKAANADPTPTGQPPTQAVELDPEEMASSFQPGPEEAE